MSPGRSAAVLLAGAVVLGALLSTRVGVVGAAATLGIALALLAVPATVFVRRERRRLLHERSTSHRRPHRCDCCSPETARL